MVNLEIMTRKYCERCPWFDEALGYIEQPAPYWKGRKDGCACRNCPDRQQCEATGPKSKEDCLMAEIRRRVTAEMRRRVPAQNIKIKVFGRG